jgi:hypothetical protein
VSPNVHSATSEKQHLSSDGDRSSSSRNSSVPAVRVFNHCAETFD